jgi:uncharacterized membrane protein YfcA
MPYVLLFPAGIAIGTVGSLLGVGGGIFMVPILLLGGLVGTTQEAAGTSIVGVLATGVSGSLAYLLRRKAPWKTGLALIPGALGGSYLGAFLAGVLPSHILALAFGAFLLYPATILILGKEPKELVRGGEKEQLHPLLGGMVGLLTGTAGSLFGIGGGVIMIPALLWLGLSMVPAAATSLLVMVPTAALATAIHALAGRTRWDLALPMAAGIVLGSQIGPALAVRLSPRTLRRLFALLLFYAAANMIRRGLGY